MLESNNKSCSIDAGELVEQDLTMKAKVCLIRAQFSRSLME